jgi:hypothetical protein
MCDLRWTLGVLLAVLALTAWLLHRLLQHHSRGSAVTKTILSKLRREASLPATYLALKPRELAAQLGRDHELRRQVDEQDFALLQRALGQQFWLSLAAYPAAAALIALAAFVLFQLRPHPPQVSHWDLRSENPDAEGRAVDTDNLLLTWKAAGCPEEAELWLENVQTQRTIVPLRSSTAQGQLRIGREQYRELLSVRELHGANRVRAIMKTPGGLAISPEWQLHVGITVLLYTDSPDYMYVSAQIDNSTARLPNHAVEGAIITWDQKPASLVQGGGVGTNIEEGWFKNPSAKVPLPRKLSADEWRRIAFAYFGEDGWRVRQDKRIPLELVEQKLIK